LEKKVIGICGTSEGPDFFTDFLVKPDLLTKDSPPEEYVHGGLIACAEDILQTLEEKQILQKHLPKNYKLVITGHSLGGAVAATLILLMKRKLIDEFDFTGSTAAQPEQQQEQQEKEIEKIAEEETKKNENNISSCKNGEDNNRTISDAAANKVGQLLQNHSCRDYSEKNVDTPSNSSERILGESTGFCNNGVEDRVEKRDFSSPQSNLARHYSTGHILGPSASTKQMKSSSSSTNNGIDSINTTSLPVKGHPVMKGPPVPVKKDHLPEGGGGIKKEAVKRPVRKVELRGLIVCPLGWAFSPKLAKESRLHCVTIVCGADNIPRGRPENLLQFRDHLVDKYIFFFQIETVYYSR